MKSFKNSFKKLTPYRYLLPSLLFILIFVGYGIIISAVESISSSPSPFYAYQSLGTNKAFLASLSISIKVAFFSTVISLIIGLVLTRVMFRLFSVDSWKFIAWLPMLVPHFVAAYLVFILVSPSGWLSSILFRFEIIAEMRHFPILVNDPHYVGVILTYVWKEVPFVILMLLPIYQELDLRYEDVVRTLGGNQWNVWRTVEFPWIWPVMFEIGLILFFFTLGAFEIPALLGVTYPKMLPILAYEWFYEGTWTNRPLAQALMVSLTLVIVASTVLLLSLTQKWRQQWNARG
jgi:putative spermidine/putrescine transport system permease protein